MQWNIEYNELVNLEAKGVYKFPQIYRDFYRDCEYNVYPNLIGTDLFNKYKELKEWAIELLDEDEIDNFLQDDDFVFMMHQGYMFWYFKADGNSDPMVYYYLEGSKTPEKKSNLSEFIADYLRSKLKY